MTSGVRSMAAMGAIALFLTSCGGGGGAGTPVPPPLAISSGAAASVPENSAGTVYQITTTGGSGTVTYSLNGPDAALFNVSAAGAVTFRVPPDFETPRSAANGNTYTVLIGANDASGSTSLQITVTVTNVADLTAVTQVGSSYTGAYHIAPVPGQARVFVTQSNGNIYLVDPATNAQGTLYLSVTGTGQRTVTAVAAAPDFATSGTLYVLVVSDTGMEVRRYGRTSAGVGDPASADVILQVPLPRVSQNLGGWIGFGTDNLLYVTTGDAADLSSSVRPTLPTTSLLGKVLRVDPARDQFPNDPLRDYGIPAANPYVNGSGAGEVYASGFANPRTGSIDGTNLYVGEQSNVSGRSSFIYLVRPSDAGRTVDPSGGSADLGPVLGAAPQLLSPGTIVAGPVYRGQSPDLSGRYIFFARGGVSGNNYENIYTVAASSLVAGTTQYPRACCTYFDPTIAVAFGEDAAHNAYLTDGTRLFAIQYR